MLLMTDIKDDMQKHMSLYGCKRYNSEQEKTDFMMSQILELCTICELTTSLRNQLRYEDRDSKVAAFVREVATMSALVVVRRQGSAYFERVLKENIQSDVIDQVISHIHIAERKFYKIEGHIRTSSITPELGRINHIITFLHIICDRLKDGQEWLVHHEHEGPWTLYIMNEENTFRTDKNPVPVQTSESDESVPRNPSRFSINGSDDRRPIGNPQANLDALKALI